MKTKKNKKEAEDEGELYLLFLCLDLGTGRSLLLESLKEADILDFHVFVGGSNIIPVSDRVMKSGSKGNRSLYFSVL